VGSQLGKIGHRPFGSMRQYVGPGQEPLMKGGPDRECPLVVAIGRSVVSASLTLTAEDTKPISRYGDRLDTAAGDASKAEMRPDDQTGASATT
jgi:hypothetical protein